MCAGDQVDIDDFVSKLLSRTSNQPSYLLQHLVQIQQTFSHIPQQAITRLAEALVGQPEVSSATIRGVIAFYAFLHEQPRGHFDIYFSDSITDHMQGSRELLQQLCQRLGVEPGKPRADGRVTVDTTSCTGMCDQGPAMLVNGYALTHLDNTRIGQIADLVEADTAITNWPEAWFRVTDNILRKDALLNDESPDGAALQALLHKGETGVLDDIIRAGLRGRGGAGFTTGMKWRFCRETEADQRYVVCNADEGEPGTFKDRVLLSAYAHRVFEGMTLCAGVIGASKGLLYLRAEYRHLYQPLQDVLQQRRKQGLLGKGILGKASFDFDIEIHLGAGAYICGEESSMLESLEGKRGIARKRPPFPVTHGYMGKPTVVNNVETFALAGLIAIHGADWFTATGTTESTGTKLLSISGDCARPGIYEYAYGVSIRQLLQDCGASDVKAVQVAGAAGVTLSEHEFDRYIEFEDVATAGSIMVFNRSRRMLDMARNFSHFFVHESCGFCTPCRVGTSLMQDLVDKIHSGRASPYDLEEIRSLAAMMKSASQCGLGATAANPVLDLLDKFPREIDEVLSHRQYQPAFDLDAALQDARDISGRDDKAAHIDTTG